MRRIVVVLSLMTVVACATSPLGRSQLVLFPEEQISAMGATAYSQLRSETPQARDPAVNAFVDCVARSVVAALPQRERESGWEVTVFEQDAVNAFALPGGKIGVYAGLLKVTRNQHQLAAVIGHEIAHVLAQHSNERISTAYATQTGLGIVESLAGAPSANKSRLMGLLGLGAQVGILLPYGREQEKEADLLGLDLMARAGFDPREAADLWRNMAEAGGARPPEFLSTHPSSDTRIRELRARETSAMQLYEQARSQGLRPDCASRPR